MTAKSAFYTDPDQTPVVHSPILDSVPTELRGFARWVLWRLVWKPNRKGGGKWDKVPFQSDGKNASCTDPATWTTFEVAAQSFCNGGFDGIGFVLGDGFAGIDLDNVRNPDTGDLTSSAAEVIEEFGTYTEASPSGTGVKMIGRGKWKGNWHRKQLPGGGEVEVYDGSRYFTLTALNIGDHPIAEIQAALSRFAERFPSECRQPAKQTRSSDDASAGGVGSADDRELISKALEAKNGAKFKRLWDGDASDYGGDDSRADLALCGILSFWCAGDSGRIDRLFRRSRLMRQKWDDRRGEMTYGERTIATAIEGKTEFYAPKPIENPNTIPSRNGVQEKPPTDSPSSDAAPNPTSAVAIIAMYFRKCYRPDFRRGNAIHTEDGEIVPMGVACEVPTSRLIEELAAASDTPRYHGGGVKRDSLPGFFKKWAKVAWGDLLESLPTEDAAILAPGSCAADEFRKLVRDAMLSEVVIGDIIGKEGVTRTERRSLVDWCVKFAKEGPWRSIRSKKCWCKTDVLGNGEIKLRVAIRHELFAQVKADRKLSELCSNTFTRRAERYRVGTSSREDRPHGQSAVVLADDFVTDLVSGILDDLPCEELDR